MATGDFLHHIRTARNVAYHYLQPHASGSGIPPHSGSEWERLRAAAPLWLSPEVAGGFVAAEFASLPPDRRAELAACVERLRIASANTGNRPPTDGEMNAGLKELGRIVELLDEWLADPEGLALLAALLRIAGPLPPFVLGLDYKLDTDWSGDPGVWIWVILSDDLDPDSEEFKDFSRRFRGIGWAVVKWAGSNRLPYLGYRPLADALNPVSEDAA